MRSVSREQFGADSGFFCEPDGEDKIVDCGNYGDSALSFHASGTKGLFSYGEEAYPVARVLPIDNNWSSGLNSSTSPVL